MLLAIALLRAIRALNNLTWLLPDERSTSIGCSQTKLGQGDGLTIDGRGAISTARGVVSGDGHLNAAAVVVVAIAATVAATTISTSWDDSLDGQCGLHLVGIAADGHAAVALATVRIGRDGGDGADENALENIIVANKLEATDGSRMRWHLP